METRNWFVFLVLASFSALLFGCTPPTPDTTDIEPVPLEFDCDVTQLLPMSDDPGERGPWIVGAKTVFLGENGKLKTEVWYPALPGSWLNKEKFNYDLRQFLPDEDAALIPDGAFDLPCNCYKNLPLDSLHGPYPVIVFVHGTAGFRTTSLAHVTHWASRGFVVVSADNPLIMLKDAKSNPIGIYFATQTQDTIDLIDDLQEAWFPLNFLQGHIDMRRVGLAGHSAGGEAIEPLGIVPGVRTIIPMGGGGTLPGIYLNSAMVVAAERDAVVPYSFSVDEYLASAKPKRLVSVKNAGHLAFTDICTIGEEQGGFIPLVESFGIDFPIEFSQLVSDSCTTEYLAPQDGWDLINYATTAAFEEVLQCKPQATAAFNDIENRFPQLFQFQEQL